MKIDELDLKILKSLAADGRAKNIDLAKQLKKPQTTVYDRIRKLEKAGVIRAYSADIDYSKLGWNITAFFLGAPSHAKDLDWKRVAKELEEIPNVIEAYFITGRDDFLIKVMYKDDDEYFKVNNQIVKILNDRSIGIRCPKTFFVRKPPV